MIHCCFLAESEGFEPSVPERYTGFRDQLLRPLGQLSIYINWQMPDDRTIQFLLLGSVAVQNGNSTVKQRSTRIQPIPGRRKENRKEIFLLLSFQTAEKPVIMRVCRAQDSMNPTTFRVKLVTTTSIRFRIEYSIYSILSHDFESAPL